MIVKFEKKSLRELYEAGKTTDKSFRFQPGVIKLYQLRIGTLEGAEKMDNLCAISSLHYEELKGSKKHSVRINDKYRIELKTAPVATETVATICDILS